MEKRKQISAEKTRIHKGTIGTSNVAGHERIICIPEKIRKRHIHVISGGIGGNKTTLIKPMTINDIKTGHGVDTSNAAEQEHIVCTPDKPRKRHVFVIGKPSMGMSRLMRNMILEDIKNGHGVAAIDLYDDMVEESLDTFPPSSQNNQAAK